MDIKLKSNKKTKRFAVIVILLAAILYTSLYPYFEKSADEYISTNGMNEFEQPEFIELLLKSNFILYKDIMDKRGDKKYSYSELFIDKNYEAIESRNTDYIGEDENSYDYAEGFERLYSGQMEYYLENYGEQIQEQLNELRNGIFSAIGKRIDYCIREKDTNTVIKNTSIDIEKLLSGDREWENPYDYYIILEYGSNGSLGEVSVRGEKADNLLKTVQLVAGGDASYLLDRKITERYAIYDEEENTEGYLSVTQKRPANVTIAYAMTREQMNNFFVEKAYGDTYESSFVGNYYYTLDRENVLYICGVHSIYMLFLLGILLVVLFMEKRKSEYVCYEGIKKYPIEVIAIVGILQLSMIVGMTVRLINYSSQDSLAQWINDTVTISISASSPLYMLMEGALNVAVLSLFFAVWYWCCLGVKDILNGVVAYVKKRSLIYRYWSQIISFFKSLYQKFKNEICHADLGGNVEKTLKKVIIINYIILAFISCFWTFGIILFILYSVALYAFTKKYVGKVQEQYKKLLEATNYIAAGNLSNTFDEDFGVFESYKEKLYEIQDGFSRAVEEEVKSQKMKTELITNVSHDLKTPLTAIITYIDLLKTENITEEQRKEYIATLERKSIRLKVLIEDLFEVSKANSRNVKLEPVPVDICNLLRQVYLEHEEKLKEQSLDMRFQLPEEKIVLQLDSQKTYRIFENLYVNISKYAMPGTRVFVALEKSEEGKVRIEMKNISAQEIHVRPDELTERFVRGDSARNTEGSGLGLAIAKSFVELQGGRLSVETDGDLFKVIIELKTFT